MVADLDERGGEESVALVEKAGGEAVLVVGDIATEAGARAACDEALARFGTVDILVNNAGVAPPEPHDSWDAPEESWDRRPADQPEEHLPQCPSGHPGADRQGRRLDRQHRLDRRHPHRERGVVRRRQGRDPRLHPPGGHGTGGARRAGQRRVARLHAHADVDRRAVGASTRRPRKPTWPRFGAAGADEADGLGRRHRGRRRLPGERRRRATSPARRSSSTAATWSADQRPRGRCHAQVRVVSDQRPSVLVSAE